jgi:hypothetical protein
MKKLLLGLLLAGIIPVAIADDVSELQVMGCRKLAEVGYGVSIDKSRGMTDDEFNNIISDIQKNSPLPDLVKKAIILSATVGRQSSKNPEDVYSLIFTACILANANIEALDISNTNN